MHWPESNRQLWISWSAASTEPADKRGNGTHWEATIRQHCQTSPTVNTTWTRPQKKKTSKGHLEKWSKVNKKLCHCKKIASHHSCYKNSRPAHGRRHLKISSYLVWSPCKMWLLFIIPRGNMYSSQNCFGGWVHASLGWGRGWPLETRPATCVTVPNLVALGQTVWAYFARFCRKKIDLSLSRSLKVEKTDMDRSATYDSLLVIRSNHAPISYRFWHKRFRSTIANSPRAFNAHAEFSSKLFWWRLGLNKLGWCPY